MPFHLSFNSRVFLNSMQKLKPLFTKSRANNGRRNITDLLLYDKESLMQFVEGEQESMEDIFNNMIWLGYSISWTIF